MSPNVQAVIARILAREGGVADVGDGMGATRWGQTEDLLAEYGLTAPNTPQEAAGNYAKWISFERLDEVCDFDLELGDDVADACVNDGAGQGIEFLQRALGVTADGRIGPLTIAAMQKANPRALRAAVLAEDIEFHGRLIARNPSEAKYAAGWAARQAEKVRRLAA